MSDLDDLLRVRQARARPELTIRDGEKAVTLKSDAELRRVEADIAGRLGRAAGVCRRRHRLHWIDKDL